MVFFKKKERLNLHTRAPAEKNAESGLGAFWRGEEEFANLIARVLRFIYLVDRGESRGYV